MDTFAKERSIMADEVRRALAAIREAERLILDVSATAILHEFTVADEWSEPREQVVMFRSVVDALPARIEQLEKNVAALMAHVQDPLGLRYDADFIRWQEEQVSE